MEIQEGHVLWQRVDGHAVDGDDDVTSAQASGFGRTAGIYVGDDDAKILGKPETFGNIRCDGLGVGTMVMGRTLPCSLISL
jgi:hypothetical protein